MDLIQMSCRRTHLLRAERGQSNSGLRMAKKKKMERIE